MTTTRSIEVGDRVPDLTLRDDGGHDLRLRDLTGRRVVLYVYPKDDTPGCTTQACSLRDSWSTFASLEDVVVYGVSPDTVESHARWRSKLDLPFHLLVDENRSLIEAFGFWVEKQKFGKTAMGVERSTVIIDEDGVVTHVLRRVRPEAHVQLLRDALGI